MKFTQIAECLGLKSSKGVYEGTEYDSTKAYIVLDLDGRKGNALGFSCEAFNIGLSSEIEKYRGVKFPAKVEADFELLSTGNDSRLIVTAIRPIPAGK